MNKYIILGASRGLGYSLFSQLIQKEIDSKFLLISRKIEFKFDFNHEIKNELNHEFFKNNVFLLNQDFSKCPIQDDFYQKIIDFQPTQIIYCAGGGPYGLFQSKKWSDHEWSLNVNFNFPAQLIHKILSDQFNFNQLKKITCVGSAIAESSPDPSAASYAAGKHALKGLITSLQVENQQHRKHLIQLQLFSPGYIKTDLLPLNSSPRLNSLAQDVAFVAGQLAQFIDSDAELG